MNNDLTHPCNKILGVKYPHLIKEWHPDKNGQITPFNITYGSAKNIWWICENGHEWQIAVKHRSSGAGCNRCKWLKIAEKKSLAINFPDIASQWHPDKNESVLTPHTVSGGSDKKIWWRCSFGHEWQEKVNNRVNGNGCPYCSGRRFTPERCLAVHVSEK